jgi:hypothetical protein
MADKILRNKVIKGKIVFPPESEEETWVPSNTCSDFYPKIVTTIDNVNLSRSFFDYYEQKKDFLELVLPKTKMVIEPVVAGWGITFENITIVYKLNKHILHAPALQGRGVTFDDTFYRFSSIYSFEEKIDAVSDKNQPFLIKSWKYNK